MSLNPGPSLEFGLGETADAIRETTARFAAAKIAPLAAEIDATNTFPRELFAWLSRFFRLFARNQWKRERYAPSFHVDDESLDPKTWYRFPILSGGFERELEELARELDLGGA